MAGMRAGMVASHLPPHLQAMAQRHPVPVLASAAGGRLQAAEAWSTGLRGEMPRHYRDYHHQWRKGPQAHIHSRPPTARFEKDEWGEIHPVQTPRIYVVYPEAFHKGLWGGEGVVKGLLKRKDGNHRNFVPPAAKYWWPTLFEGVVHSELLGRHIEMVVTKRGVRLVDEASGFDHYLLSTPVNEVYATGLLRIKRELLLALAGDSLPDSLQRRYGRHRVPLEEADWHGLTLGEASLKQTRLLAQREEAAREPAKAKLRRELLQELREGRFQGPEEEVEEVGRDKGVIGGIKGIFGK